MDFPLYIPSNVFSCGPILFPIKPLAEKDAKLNLWLQKPTVLVCLGSHFQIPAETAVELAKGLKHLMDSDHSIQVLWKLKTDMQESHEFQEAVGDVILDDRMNIMSWIEPDIISV